MRILKVTQAYYPFLEKGGPAVKVPAIARKLVQRGNSVTVLTVDHGLRSQNPNHNAPGDVSDQRNVELEGVEVIYLPAIELYRALTLNPAVFSFCRKRLRQFDLIHIYGLYDLLGPVVASFCRRSGVPYTLEPMGMYQPIVRGIGLKRTYHRLLGRNLTHGARYLVATSNQERDELIEGGVPQAKIVVRPNGIERPSHLPAPGAFRREWNMPSEVKFVLFLGRIVPKKSPELLLKAFARYLADGHQQSEAFLVMAGPCESDGYRTRLQTLVAELGLTGTVLFTGPLFNDAKWAAYQDADIFVLPSQNENFGNAAAEAIACGLPVLVTDRCGIAPLVGDQAGVVVPHDVGALHAALSMLLENVALRHRLRAGCLQLAPRLSWQEPISLMESVYARMLEDASEPEPRKRRLRSLWERVVSPHS